MFLAMKRVGRFKCHQCGSVHNGISEKDAAAAVAAFNIYLATLTSEEQKEWYGGAKISIDSYMRCFYCGAPSNEFIPARKGDGPAATNQLIITPICGKK